MLLAAPMALVMLAASAPDSESSAAECEGISRADRIRGNYENKVRFYSPPEKVFEIFATHKTEEGELRMTYADFLRAMTPFSQTEFFEDTEEYVKECSPEILKRVDVDGDGNISFCEFFFFLVLAQIPPIKLRRVFNKYEGGKLTKEQMSTELRNLRNSTRAGKRQQAKTALDGRAIKTSEEDFTAVNSGIVSQLFAAKELVGKEDII